MKVDVLISKRMTVMLRTQGALVIQSAMMLLRNEGAPSTAAISIEVTQPDDPFALVFVHADWAEDAGMEVPIDVRD